MLTTIILTLKIVKEYFSLRIKAKNKHVSMSSYDLELVVTSEFRTKYNNDWNRTETQLEQSSKWN